jgi:hypothetical protein
MLQKSAKTKGSGTRWSQMGVKGESKQREAVGQGNPVSDAK